MLNSNRHAYRNASALREMLFKPPGSAHAPLRSASAVCAVQDAGSATPTTFPFNPGLSAEKRPDAIESAFMRAAANDPGTRPRLASWPYRENPARTHPAPADPEQVPQPEPREKLNASQAAGQFITGSVTNSAGTRNYRLYIPACYRGQAMPLVVMLHGCNQDPDDFAAGTRMNFVAEEKECFVLYPEQSKTANRNGCWNWFNSSDQRRERGEPSLIADITREVMSAYPVDRRRVYIAGLSAGGAMAVIMATAYPDIYSAAGVHSGMAYSSAKSLFSALTAMKHGPRPHWTDAFGLQESPAPAPMIVFHGDADTVVHPINGEHVIRQAVGTGSLPEGEAIAGTQAPCCHGEDPETRRTYTRHVFRDDEGRELAEQWVIHGSGHAWSGGSIEGSFTDPDGPDASREMIRFFYERCLPPEPATPAEADLLAY